MTLFGDGLHNFYESILDSESEFVSISNNIPITICLVWICGEI